MTNEKLPHQMNWIHSRAVLPKMASALPLAALRAFHAVGATGSKLAAAARLGVTPSAVSHQVRRLEAALGTSPFLRTPRQLRPTAAGTALLAALDRAFGIMTSSIAAARAGDPGWLRTSALPSFTEVWLIPRLGRFRARHPDIALTVETTSCLVDLEADGVDVAIRNSRVVPPAMRPTGCCRSPACRSARPPSRRRCGTRRTSRGRR